MGRKKQMKTETKVEIRLRVDGDFFRRVQQLADEEGNSVAAFVRAVLARELKRREKEEPQ
jgi:hypothetical protein